jgi:hypothetical protein
MIQVAFFASLFSHDLMLRIPGLALLVQQEQKLATALAHKTSAPKFSDHHFLGALRAVWNHHAVLAKKPLRRGSFFVKAL